MGCGPFPTLSNGNVTYSTSGSEMNGGYRVDTAATFTCDNGYALPRYSSSTCQDSGRWDNYISSCDPGNEINILQLFHIIFNKIP